MKQPKVTIEITPQRLALLRRALCSHIAYLNRVIEGTPGGRQYTRASRAERNDAKHLQKEL